MPGRGHPPLLPHRRCHPPHRPSRRHPPAGTVTEVGNEVGPVVGQNKVEFERELTKGKESSQLPDRMLFPASWVAGG